MKIEKKFFRVRVARILPSIASKIDRKLAVVELKELKRFLKNITTGGAE